MPKKPPSSEPPAGPENLGDILARLFVARGWGRKQDRLRLEAAWAEAVGPEALPQTRLAGHRRGVFEVEVKSTVLIQELAQFRKRALLEALRKRLPGLTITDLRFRAAAW